MMARIKNSKTIFRSGLPGDFSAPPARQTGAILLIAVVVLVAMTLSALALIKSVNTTNLIAGNLGFRESALLASERSTERALHYLDVECTGSCLYEDGKDNGKGKACYWSTRTDPTSDKNWDVLMNELTPCGFSDGAGNNVWYVIQRLCLKKNKSPTEAQCSLSPNCRRESGLSVGGTGGCSGNKIYYRITTRVNGPRNTAVYTQTIITK
jgi:Tfp pilus assembly protein PilX